jgi:hypothetical protein
VLAAVRGGVTAKALGYRRLVIYTQRGETGGSLHAAGWQVIAYRPPHHGGSRRRWADATPRIFSLVVCPKLSSLILR